MISSSPIKINLMKKTNYLIALMLLGVGLISSSCDEDSTPVPAPTLVKSWMINLSNKNEIPATASRNESGMATLELYSDNSLKYTINVTGLASGDALTNSHIHVGNVISNGGVVLDLKPSFSSNNATATIPNLRPSFVDSLKSDANDLYINVHSSQLTAGIVRGQLNKVIDVAADVVLSGANEVPSVTTTATGLATIRVTSDKTLYIKTVISNLESTDAMTAAHLHKAAAGANAGVLIGFYANAADFGTTKILPLTDAIYNSLKSDAVYVNAHSTLKTSGLVRGQIR